MQSATGRTPGSIDASLDVTQGWNEVRWRAAGELDSSELQGDAMDSPTLSAFSIMIPVTVVLSLDGLIFSVRATPPLSQKPNQSHD